MLLDNISTYSSCLISTLQSTTYDIPIYDNFYLASFHFNDKNKANYLCNVDEKVEDLMRVLDPVKIPIVLKGINIWFLYQPMHIWYPFLADLISRKTVVLIFHQELDLSENISHLQILRDLTQLHIEFSPGKREILYKKTSGKVQRETKMDKVEKKAILKQPAKIEVIYVLMKEPKPQSNSSKQDPISSFNLSLTDQQRTQKDGLVLPYTKAQDAVIDYIVDKEDDFDSDDPDDDLDI